MTAPAANLTLHQVVEHWSIHTPDALALQFERGDYQGRRFSWRDLNILRQQYAHWLDGNDIIQGDNVAVLLDDSPGCHCTLYALMTLGITIVPIDTSWGAQVIDNIFNQARVQCVIGSPHTAAHYDETNIHRITWPDTPDIEASPLYQHDHSSPEQRVFIAFTSGTTAAPKGVPIRHHQIRAAYRRGTEQLGLSSSNPVRTGCSFRLSGLGVLGIHYLFANEFGSCSVVLPELTPVTSKQYWAFIREHRIGFWYLVPTLVRLLNHFADNRHALTTPSSCLCVTAAGPITQQDFEQFQDKFQHPLLNIYGLTELCFAVLFGDWSTKQRGAFTIGKANGLPVQLRNSAGDIITTPETMGELFIQGPMLVDGYYHNPEATADIFPDGWLKTGDLAWYDGTSRIHIKGRVKDVVIRGGFNIHLAEIDEVTASHPDILDACSFSLNDVSAQQNMHGHPTDTLFQHQNEHYAVLVSISQQAQISEALIKDWISQQAGQYKVPARVFFTYDPLPRNGAGKLVRREAHTVALQTAV